MHDRNYDRFRGSVIAKIVGINVRVKKDEFVETVQMYVYEEIINGEKLTDIINFRHENVKYLPGTKLPDNVVGLILMTRYENLW
jgi:glycerol-3-phosphate dehydrogenase (NAD+)